MKIITKCEISWETLEVTNLESYEWSGPIALCKGGGSAGEVDYPDYMKAAHEDWLTQSGTDAIEDSITSKMNAALGSSPWSTKTAYNPDTTLATANAAVTVFAAMLANFTSASLFGSIYDVVSGKLTTITAATEITEAVLLAETAAYSDLLDDEIETKTLPAFKAGMQDVNLVTSSAFVVGEALIYAFKNRDLAKYTADIRLNAANKNADIRISNNQNIIAMNQIKGNLTDAVLRLVLSGSDTLMKTTAELSRISIVAKKEQNDLNNEIAAKDAVWDLEVFQYGGNLLASVSGSSMATQKPSAASSVIGGAMSGAAAGTAIAPGIGTAIGAGIGAIAGIFG